MKKNFSFYSPFRLNKTVMCLLVLPLITAGITIQSANAQDTPFDRLKRVAQAQPEVNTEVSKVTITAANPVWKANSRQAVPFKPFELKDKNGRQMRPDEMVTLSNGKQVTARAAIDELNAIERKLNAQGFSLRNRETVNASQTVTRSADLDGKLRTAPIPVSSKKSATEVKDFMSPVKRVGDVTLKPVAEYTETEKNNLQGFSFENRNGKLGAKKLAVPLTPILAFPVSGNALRTINETSSKDWSFGSASTVKASIHGELTRYAKIYSFDPRNPYKNRSEFKITAKGNIDGYLFSRHLDLFNSSAEFFAPEDTSKKMTAKVIIAVSGLTIYNFNQSFSQHKNLSGRAGKSLHKSAGIEVPIIGPIVFVGKIGVRGSAGLEYSGNLYRTFVSVVVTPAAELSGYAEAGISAGGVASLGVGGNLSFIKGELDMNAFAGVWIQNANQIVAAVSYYFGYDLEILKGNLYAYAEVCVPDWVPVIGGDCSRYSHNIFNWSGFRSSGTIAEGTKTYVIANL